MLVNMRLKIWVFTFMIYVFCCNCKKNQDQMPPSIVIQMPLSNSSFFLDKPQDILEASQPHFTPSHFHMDVLTKELLISSVITSLAQ